MTSIARGKKKGTKNKKSMSFFLCEMSFNIADSRSSEKLRVNTIFEYMFWAAFLGFSDKDSTLNFAKSGFAVKWKSTAKL